MLFSRDPEKERVKAIAREYKQLTRDLGITSCSLFSSGGADVRVGRDEDGHYVIEATTANMGFGPEAHEFLRRPEFKGIEVRSFTYIGRHAY